MMPLTLAEVGEENIIRRGHGDKCHRGQCHRKRKGFPYCG